MLHLLLLAAPLDLSAMEKPTGFSVERGKATLSSAAWAFLRQPAAPFDAELALTFSIAQPAKSFRFFGESWSVWPDRRWLDDGFELGVEMRAGESGYRVQASHRNQCLALVRWPDGGYVRVSDCPLALGKPHRLAVRVQANVVVVSVDGKERLRYVDPLATLAPGGVAIGTSSGAKVDISDADLAKLPPAKPTPSVAHIPDFSVKKWLGGRLWVFDGSEPILLLPSPQSPSLNCAKLRPGRKPMLSWNGHWDIQNQGAYPAGTNVPGPVTATGGGKTVTASWDARQAKGRFVTRTMLTTSWDARRQAYRFATESELEVLPGEPFEFRYGYDFEHHTPLDPFRWQYLLFRTKGGPMQRRPVYPVDPGPQENLETKGGLRVWHGRHGETAEIAPAVEYDIDTTRKLNTAVCAAFYDTGVSFPAEKAKAGTRVKVRYAYTGYPANEARELFAESTVYPSHMLDPGHRYVFAEGWPRLGFHESAPMSETWIYGRRPLMTAHNRRPTYELVDGKILKLGPASFGGATLATPAKLAPGRYAVLARVRGDNLIGPGGRIELGITVPKAKEPARHVHHVGNGAFGWKTTGFAFDVPAEGASISLGLGNAGTGDMLVRELVFRKIEGELPPGVAAKPSPASPYAPSPRGAIADYRMGEGKGLHVFDHAGGPLGHLELSSVGWGKGSLVFKDEPGRKASFPRAGVLERGYLGHPSYKGRDTLPVAVAGHHGGAMPLEAFTLAAWVKPAAEMGRSDHGGAGDVAGLGARRIVLRLIGQKAPYKLGCAINVNDRFETAETLAAGEWRHVAVTGTPEAGAWRIKLWLDGKEASNGLTKTQKGPLNAPPSLVLGSELFYFHHAWYRGELGRVLAFGRALEAAEVAAVARGR